MPLSSLRRTTRERKYALDAIEAALRRLQAEDGGARSREQHIALLDSVAQELEGWQQKVHPRTLKCAPRARIYVNFDVQTHRPCSVLDIRCC